MSLAIRVAFEPLRSLAFGLIGPAYTEVGLPFDHPLRQLIVENLTDQVMIFSVDGINDHFALPAGGPVIFDFTSNKTIMTGFFLPLGAGIYVRDNGIAPALGAVYVSAIYGAGEQ